MILSIALSGLQLISLEMDQSVNWALISLDYAFWIGIDLLNSWVRNHMHRMQMVPQCYSQEVEKSRHDMGGSTKLKGQHARPKWELLWWDRVGHSASRQTRRRVDQRTGLLVLRKAER
jgi:hypothetical protein